MIKYILLIYFLLFQQALACNFSTSRSLLDPKVLEMANDLTPPKCFQKRNDIKACRCAKEDIFKADLPNELHLRRKRKYLDQLLETAKINLLSVSHDILALSSHEEFKDSEDIGKACSPKQIKTCSNGNYTEAEISNLSKDLIENFKIDFKNRQLSTNFIDGGFIDKELRDNSCRTPISDEFISKINLEHSYSALLKISSVISEHYKDGISISEIFNSVQSKVDLDQNELMNSIYYDLQANPLLWNALDSPEQLRDFHENNFEISYIKKFIDSKENIQSQKAELKERCTETYNKISEILCGPIKSPFPKSYTDLKRIINDNLSAEENLDIYQANEEIALYCKNQKSETSSEYDEIRNFLSSKTHSYLNKYSSVREATNKSYNANYKLKQDLLCNEENLNHETLISKIEKMGCNENNSSQDCTYLKTIDALYSDQIQESPNLQLKDLLAMRSKDPLIVRAFLGEDLDSKEASEDATPTPGQSSGSSNNPNQVTAVNGDIRGGKVNSAENNGDSYTTNSAISSSTHANSNSKSDDVEKNMQDLYREVARRIRKGEAAEQVQKKQKSWNPFNRNKNKVISDTVRQAISGSINNYDFDDYPAAEVASFEDNGRENFFENGFETQGYSEETKSQRQKREWENALRDRNNSLAKNSAGNSGRSIASIAGSESQVQPSISYTEEDLDIFGEKVINIDPDKSLDVMLAELKDGKLPGKDQILEFLQDKKVKVFYITSIDNPKLKVKVKKNKDGTLSVREFRPSKKHNGYSNFLEEMRNKIELGLNKTNEWIELLTKGYLEKSPTSYKDFVN